MHNRVGEDEALFREVLKESWISEFFVVSLGALLLTASALLFLQERPSESPLPAMSGTRNLLLVAAFAFAVNVATAGASFWRAVRLLGPSRWRDVQRRLASRQIVLAVRAHARRLAQMSDHPIEQLVAFARSSPEEDEANRLIRQTIESAGAAARNRGFSAYQDAFDTVRELIETAVAELPMQHARLGIEGAFPPIQEIRKQLPGLRREVYRLGWTDYSYEFARFDHWLLARGAEWRAGDIYEAGLDGMRDSVRAALEVAPAKDHDVILPRAWINLGIPITTLAQCVGTEADEAEDCERLLLRTFQQFEAYFDSLIRQQGSGHIDDFLVGLKKHLDYATFVLGGHAGRNAALVEELQRDARFLQMGIGGRVIELARTGDLADEQSYLDSFRTRFTSIQQLARDLGTALSLTSRSDFSWDAWQMDRAPGGRRGAIHPEICVLSFFVVRALELGATDTPLEFGGHKARVADYTKNHVADLARFARFTDPATQRDDAVRALLAGLGVTNELE